MEKGCYPSRRTDVRLGPNPSTKDETNGEKGTESTRDSEMTT